MKPDRLNALTDGVVAVVLTLTVIELRAPRGVDFASLRPWLGLLGVYALSFVNVGIYWNNHHHMMQSARVVDGQVLWATSRVAILALASTDSHPLDRRTRHKGSAGC